MHLNNPICDKLAMNNFSELYDSMRKDGDLLTHHDMVNITENLSDKLRRQISHNLLIPVKSQLQIQYETN